MFGALIGIGGAALLFGSGQITKLSGGMFPVFELTPRIAGMAFLIAAVLGLISSIMPAISVARMSVVQGLKTID